MGKEVKKDEIGQTNKEPLPYRQGVIGLILHNNRFLVVQMTSYQENQWRFPGGGINEGEDPKDALLRELNEELGSNKFKIEKRSNHIIQYDWPNEIRERQFKKHGIMWCGQQQIQFLVSFEGEESELKTDPDELKNIKWATLEELPKLFVFQGQWEKAKKTIDELIS